MSLPAEPYGSDWLEPSGHQFVRVRESAFGHVPRQAAQDSGKPRPVHESRAKMTPVRRPPRIVSRILQNEIRPEVFYRRPGTGWYKGFPGGAILDYM